jgi:RHH-type proline utilization regulon transcriptional repressor/proline dehydrogenase/delta 1-pyrroline-5-carboxylate dehydrogenase
VPSVEGAIIGAGALAAAFAALPPPAAEALSVETLPGPTGESNRLSVHARGRVLCLGPSAEAAEAQARAARALGCAALAAAPGVAPGFAGGLDGRVAPEALTALPGLDAVVFHGPEPEARALRRALAARPGPIVPLVLETDLAAWLTLERCVCIDTTAAGGNATLLAESGA